MNADDVQVIERTSPFQGYFRIDRYRLRHRLFEGGWSGEMVREIFERGHAVAVLPYDPDQDRVVLIEQFRPGAYAALDSPWFDRGAFSPWLVECVAGIIEDGEAPDQVARREAIEEADCPIQDLVPVCRYLVSPGGSSESVFVYVGRVAAPAGGTVHGLGNEHENIRTLVVSADEAFRLMDEGRIVNAMTLIAMQWFRLNRDRLRARWATTARGGARP